MSVSKKKVAISTVDEWGLRAGPKREHQWADGRSAKEAAKCWLGAANGHMPRQVEQALGSNASFARVERWSAEPEVRLYFDKFAGEPRNTDLLVRATDVQGEFLVVIEAKADESFGETVTQALAAAAVRREKNPRSRGVERVQGLLSTLLATTIDAEPSVGLLRYQLLTATAGALETANETKIGRVVLLIQEFRTDKTVDRRHERNSVDLDAFIDRLSGGQHKVVRTGEIQGPIKLTGAKRYLTKLFVGKIVHDLRAGA